MDTQILNPEITEIKDDKIRLNHGNPEVAHKNVELSDSYYWICPECKEQIPYDLEICKKCDITNFEYIMYDTDENIIDVTLEDVEEKIKKKEMDINSVIRRKAGKDTKWQSIEEFNKDNKFFDVFINPVLGYAISFGFIFAIVGIVLKAIDSGLLLIYSNELLGIVWYGVIASILIQYFFNIRLDILVGIGLFYIGTQMGFAILTFVLSLALVGVVFGYPLGSIIGSLYGIYKKATGRTIAGARKEKFGSYLKGIIIPAIFLAIVTPLYLFWLNPILWALLENN